MDYEKMMKLMNEMSKAVRPDDRLQKILDENSDMSEEELDLVAGGIKIPDFKFFEEQ